MKDVSSVNNWLGLPIELETVLLFLILFSGCCWLLATFGKYAVFLRISRTAFWILCIGFLFRAWGYEPFSVPTSSMMPSVRIGDTVWVNKHTYGFRWPILKTWIKPPNMPARNEVIVFTSPKDGKTLMVKRVFGLPGDEILWLDGNWWVNGRQVIHQEQQLVPLDWTGLTANKNVWLLEQYSLTYPIVKSMKEDELSRLPMVWRVPGNKMFVLGDNRPYSEDSRVWGFVPVDGLIGRVEAVSNLKNPQERNRLNWIESAH